MKKCAENERKAVPKCFLHCRKKGSEMGAEKKRERGGRRLSAAEKYATLWGFPLVARRMLRKNADTQLDRERRRVKETQ